MNITPGRGNNVSEASHPIFQQFLNRGEKITWSGKPRQGFLLHRSDVFFIPFQDKIWSIVMLSAAACILLLRFLVDAVSAIPTSRPSLPIAMTPKSPAARAGIFLIRVKARTNSWSR